jgi:hypothetical protein
MMRKTIQKYPWLIYLVPLSIVIALYLSFRRYDFLYSSIRNARYLLSALVQSEASIIAIVITLTLISIQLWASNSQYVAEILRKSPHFWGLVSLYTVGIISGFVALKMVEEVNAVSEIEILVNAVVFWGFFCFAALPFFAFFMLNVFEISFVIRYLSERVNKANLLEKDPIYPIIEIVIDSVLRYDIETTETGMKAINDKTDQLFRTGTVSSNEERVISIKIYNHFLRLGKEALARKNEHSANIVLEVVKNLGKTAKSANLNFAANRLVLLLTIIGESAAVEQLELVTEKAVNDLCEVALIVGSDALSVDEVNRVAESLGKIAGIARSHGWFELADVSQTKTHQIKRIVASHGSG